MPASPLRQVRVFISSTFRDMNAERDHLVTVVFPELRDRVERLGLEFFDVDLRWGVPHEDLDGERANSWAYCKRWIDEVEPFFACMLGQRYGWRPPAEEIVDEDDREQYRGMSITEMEIRHALFHSPHDKHALFYLRETEVPEGVGKYATFVDADDRDNLQKLKTLIRQSGRPVRPYAPTWTGDVFTDLHEFGVAVLEDLWGAILRDERYVPHAAWKQVLGENWAQSPLHADPSQTIAEETWKQLIEAAKPPPGDPLDVEAEQMARFAASRLRWFQGRTHELAELHAFVEGDLPDDASRLCVVRAAAGTGKTALLAKLAEGLGDGCLLLTHFVGASERSSDARSLLERLLQELDRHNIPDPEPEEKPELDLNGLSRQLARRLAGYDGEKRLVILLDALNQLTDGHSLFWLPQQLGPNVRLVVSCLDDPQAAPESPAARVLQALQYRRPEPRWVDLAPLDEADVREIVREYLLEYCKELDRDQTDAIAAMPQARNPLYLRVMLDVLRAMGGNDMHLQVRDRIANLPTERPDATSLFEWVLERLAPFGEENVRLWCSYLALGRVGMSSEELVALLTRKRGPEAGAAALRIERALRRYLQRRGPQWDFFHGALREAVKQYCLAKLGPVELHADIAAYLETRWRDGDVHALSELPYHQTKGQQTEALLATLTDYHFLDAKLRGVSVQSLIEDCERAETAAGLGEDEARSLRLIGGALRLSAHVVDPDPDQLPSQSWGRLAGFEEAAIQGLLASAKESTARPWMRPVATSLTPPGGPLLRVLSGHIASVGALSVTSDSRRILSAASWPDNSIILWDLLTGEVLALLGRHALQVNALALSADAAVAVSGGGTPYQPGELRLWDLVVGQELSRLCGHSKGVLAVDITPDGRLAVSVSHDRTLRMWDVALGEAMLPICESDETMRAVAITPDGRLALTGGGDRHSDAALRVWDLATGNQLHVLGGHTAPIRAVAVTRDGTLAVSGSDDGTVRVWNLSTMAELRSLSGHSGQVRAVAVSDDGRLAVSGGGVDLTLGDVRVWDMTTGSGRQAFIGHASPVNAVKFTPDGQSVISGSDDTTVRVWTMATSPRPSPLVCHDLGVRAVAFTPDGLQAVSASFDRSLRVWDVKTRTAHGPLQGHTDYVWGVAIAPNGRLAVSASIDKSLRVWDLEAGAEVRALHGHQHRVWAVAVAPDGEHVVSASQDGTVMIWNLHTGAALHVLRSSRDVYALALTPDGSRVISGDGPTHGPGAVNVWDLATGARLHTMAGHGRSVTSIAAGPDGTWAVSASEDGTLKVWDILEGRELCTLGGHTERVNTVVVTPDGQHAVSGSSDGTVRVWDVAAGQQLLALTGHSGDVLCVVVSPDGRCALSGSADSTLRLWDLADGTHLATLTTEAQPWACAPSPNVALCAVGDAGGHVHFLRLENVTPGPPIITAWRAPGDNVTAFGCLHCRVWSEVPSSALGTELPCPNCGKAVKLNPFVVEADWRPVAAAWNREEP